MEDFDYDAKYIADIVTIILDGINNDSTSEDVMDQIVEYVNYKVQQFPHWHELPSAEEVERLDRETAHEVLDGGLVQIAEAAGYDEFVELFWSTPKWYA
jgi:hypothetical protein